MTKRTLATFLTLALVCAFSAVPLFAAAPARTLGFQGQLFNNSTPLTGSVNAAFTFYDAASGGNTTGSTISKTITVNNGYFGTQFTESDLSGVNFNQALYVQVTINGTNLSPRTAINSAPSALKSFGAFSYSSAPTVGPAGSMYFNTTDGVLYISNGTSWGASNPWTANGSNVSFMGGNVGIGTTTPDARLVVQASGVNNTASIKVLGAVGATDFMIFERGGAPTQGLLIGRALPSSTQYTGASYLRASGSVNENIEIGAGKNLSSVLGYVAINPGGATLIGSSGTPSAILQVSSTTPSINLFQVTGSGSNSLTYTSGGGLGIGTTSPIGKLAVVGTSASTEDVLFVASSTGGSLFSVSPTGRTVVNRSREVNPLLAHSDNQGGFHLLGVPGNQNTLVMYGSGNANNVLVGYAHSGTASVPAATVSGNFLMRMVGGGYTGSAFTGKAEVSILASETWSSTSTGAFISFRTTANGQTSTTEKMRIDNNGFVGIGTTTPTASLHASGTIRFSSFGAGTLSTDADGNLTVSSDERLKDVEGTFATGLESIKGIVPITYKWKSETGYDTQHSYAGFSAQNVQSAIPEAVSTDSRGFLSLSDRPILAALVNAVKEIAAKIDLFKNEFTTKKLCVEKVNGAKICVNGDELEAALANGNIHVPAIIPTVEPVAPVVEASSTEPVASSTPEVVAVEEPVVEVPAEVPPVVEVPVE